MTTRVAIMVPAPGHNQVRITPQNLVGGVWVDDLVPRTLQIGELVDHLAVYDNRRYLIEEIPNA